MLWSSPETAVLATARLAEMGYEPWPADKVRAIAVIRDTRITAMVVYSGHQPRYGAVEMSIVSDSPRWATRETIFALLAYPFNQLKVQRVTSAIRADNTRSIKLCAGLGFQLEGRVRRGYGDVDALIYGLLAEEWRAGKYGHGCGARTGRFGERQEGPLRHSRHAAGARTAGDDRRAA